jgi:DNA-binding PadR family transcriptional regulator
MSRLFGSREEARALAAERRQVLEALNGGALTGPAVMRRISETSGAAAAPGDESLLYPALHSLEAEWRLTATWQSDAQGKPRRSYRRRRLLGR